MSYYQLVFLRFLHTVITVFFLFQVNNNYAQIKQQTYYTCPPCGCNHDDKIAIKSGECPSCNMPLIKRSGLEIPKAELFTPLKIITKPLNVAVFLYEDNQVLDFAGPYDAFVSAGHSFNVYTIGATLDPIITQPNLSVNPEYNIQNSPKPDILVIPAGNHQSISQEARKWIIESAQSATYVLSVCNGAFLVAELGLLDGLDATCHFAGLDHLQKSFPKIKKVHRNTRYVDNGKIITSAGVSAGIDASYHIISKILGVKHAKAAAHRIEYIYWKPEKLLNE